jgi:hypothetical protein
MIVEVGDEDWADVEGEGYARDEEYGGHFEVKRGYGGGAGARTIGTAVRSVSEGEAMPMPPGARHGY